MKIELELMLFLAELYKAVPMITPDRYRLIFEMASEVWEERKEVQNRMQTVVVDVHNENSFSTSTHFQLTVESIVQFEQDIPQVRTLLPFYEKLDKILLPSTYYCCGKNLKIISYYATVPLYTDDGLIKAKSFHSKCKKCKTTHYYGFSEDITGR